MRLEFGVVVVLGSLGAFILGERFGQMRWALAVAALALLVATWLWNALVYADLDEPAPTWLVAIWLASWGMLLALGIEKLGQILWARGRRRKRSRSS
jgi:RsiW-degrading membrane proteinase PrsW (M82 family)